MPKPMPYDFILDYLPEHIVVKQNFGMFYIYLNKKMMLILRRAASNQDMNGIWVTSSKQHHRSLQEDVPALGDFVLDNGEVHDSDWRFLKDGHEDFEESAIKLCELISHGDKRIGKETKGGAMLG
jgi:hypothetical protein